MTEPDTSNALRLTGREWVGVGLFSLLVILGLPPLWKSIEKFEPGTDYRIPYELSNDYWLYERFARRAAEGHEVLLVGDSVIWGQYVLPGQTLSHFLNVQAGRERFANLGLDGSHPAALEGLVEHYGGALRGKNVVLHFNPLWMSSAKHDLRIDEEFRFNHPRLVPQFYPAIECYREETSRRIGNVFERYVPFFSWTSHLQAAYFEGMSIPAWTMEHPYDNPLAARTPLDDKLRHEPISWTASGIKKQDFAWVDLEGSIQWRSFRRAVEILKSRGDRVAVVVGPFNEHLLETSSLESYRKLKGAIEEWLRVNGIAHFAPPALPSELYADASHPLSAGYALLAKQILESDLFK